MTIRKYLEDALLFEEKGYQLYTKLAAEASNDLARKLFESLAEQEQYHMDSIQSYTNNTNFQKIEFDSLEDEIHNIFDVLEKEMIAKDLNQVPAIEQAMKMEQDGYNLYKKAHDETADEKDKEFLKQLMSMELEHYEGLANLHYYYTDNANWTAGDEAQVWNWMNL